MSPRFGNSYYIGLLLIIMESDYYDDYGLLRITVGLLELCVLGWELMITMDYSELLGNMIIRMTMDYYGILWITMTMSHRLEHDDYHGLLITSCDSDYYDDYGVLCTTFDY